MAEELKRNQVDYENVTRTKPLPEPMTDVDTSGVFTDAIIEAASSQELDTAILNSFSTITRSREEVLNLLDLMGEDPIISTALSIYAADACEPSEEGKIIWCSSNDAKITHAVNHILDNLNIDTNAYSWMYSLCKYGDVYLRLYRESDFDKFKELFKTQSDDKEQLNEGILVTKYSKNDRYANYVEMIKNPGEMYDLSKFGKTFGYIKTNVIPQDELATRGQYDTNQSFYNNRTFNKNDIEIFNATDFIHICLDDNSSRTAEEVTLITNEDSDGLTFSVKRGQSILYNAFRVWRELSLLENSVLLNRVTNSSIIRTVSVEVGDMAPEAVRDLLMKIKQMFEQKSSLSKGRSFAEYTNPGPIENTIYIPTHDGKGNITTAEVGSQSGMNDQLNDLDYWKNKLYGALGIPKQFIGATEDSTGFNGGSSLSLISSRYAKTIRRLQNAFIQAIEDAVNLILFDNGDTEYIGKFHLEMQKPTTQEEKDRRANQAEAVNLVENIMRLIKDEVEDKQTRIGILKILLSSSISNVEVINLLDQELEKLESGEGDNGGEEGSDEFGDFGANGSQPLDLDFGNDELPPMEEPTEPAEPEVPQESFYSGEGSELLVEDEDLPNWEDLGVHFNEIN